MLAAAPSVLSARWENNTHQDSVSWKGGESHTFPGQGREAPHVFVVGLVVLAVTAASFSHFLCIIFFFSHNGKIQHKSLKVEK